MFVSFGDVSSSALSEHHWRII